MFSIRESLPRLAAAALLFSAGGCALQTRSTPVAVNIVAIEHDDAMTHRNWERSSALYPGGAVLAGSTRFYLTPDANADARVQQLADVPLFIVNTIFLPVTLFIEAPMTPVTYRGATVPPTFNANPPLPMR